MNGDGGGSVGQRHTGDFSFPASSCTAAPSNKGRIDENGSFMCLFFIWVSQVSSEAKCVSVHVRVSTRMNVCVCQIFIIAGNGGHKQTASPVRQRTKPFRGVCFFKATGVLRGAEHLFSSDSRLSSSCDCSPCSPAFGEEGTFLEYQIVSDQAQLTKTTHRDICNVCMNQRPVCVPPPVFVSAHQQVRGAVAQADAGEVSR